MKIPEKIDELVPIHIQILGFLDKNPEYAYSSRELAEELEFSHSTMRKHLKEMYDNGILMRKKKSNYNKTYFYYQKPISDSDKGRR